LRSENFNQKKFKNDKIPPIKNPKLHSREMKIKPAKLPKTIIAPINQRILLLEIGVEISSFALLLSDASLIAKLRFYKGKAEISNGGRILCIFSQIRGQNSLRERAVGH
jgi:hypothetical protein